MRILNHFFAVLFVVVAIAVTFSACEDNLPGAFNGPNPLDSLALDTLPGGGIIGLPGSIGVQLPNCDCPGFEPVCANGITFPNACVAECLGITNYVAGQCLPPAPIDSMPQDTFSNVPPTVFCSCPDVLAPVCGDNGITYPNACIAECLGILNHTDGSCFPTPEPCLCANIFAPVCVNGQTFPNACLAQCAGFDSWIDGACNNFPNDTLGWPTPPDCACPTVFAPVCANGQTFPNACLAQCAGFTEYTEGECSTNGGGGTGTPCNCPNVLEPVCANGQTFPNACLAQCAGYSVYTAGPCP